MLDKFDEASDALKEKSYDKVKAAFELQSVHFELDSGTEVVFKRIKVIKMADKSDFGWSTVNEYLSDELASNSDDEKRMYRAERRAERKAEERRSRFRPTDGNESASSTCTAFSSRSGPSYTASGQPNRTVYVALRSVWGLVLKQVVFFTLQVRLALFSPPDLWRYSQAISNILQYLLAIFASCFSINFW